MNKNIMDFQNDLIGLLEKWKIKSKQPINSICITAKKGEIPQVEINSSIVGFKEEKKTLSDKFMVLDLPSYKGNVYPEEDVKEAIIKFIENDIGLYPGQNSPISNKVNMERYNEWITNKAYERFGKPLCLKD